MNKNIDQKYVCNQIIDFDVIKECDICGKMLTANLMAIVKQSRGGGCTITYILCYVCYDRLNLPI